MAITTAQSPFRTDPLTGLRIDLAAQALVKTNAVLAVVFLLVGGLAGLLVALTRWPAVHLLPADLFYMALTAHGLVALVVWIVFFEMAVIYFCATSLLSCRLAAPKWAWAQVVLMTIGTAITTVAVLQGESSVMFSAYVPLAAAPHFYLGIILFAVGALIGCFVFWGTLVIAKEEKTYEGSLPLTVYGCMIAVVIAVFTLATGAIILIPAFLWSLGLIKSVDPMMYRVIFWGFGHSSQQINVVAHITIWYTVAGLAFGAKPMSEKVSRTAFLLYICFLQLGSTHHLLSDPGLSASWKIVNTSYMMYLAVLASLIHGLTVPGSIEVAQRRNGLNNGLFEWLRKCPWGNPVFSSTILSIIIFGFIGGISGVVMSVEQINMIIHNTIYVPGHFHATVAGGTTLAFMGLTYYLIPVLFQRQLIMKPLAAIQPWLFGGGMTVFGVALMGAGTLGVPRRHQDMTFAGQALSYDYGGMNQLLMAVGEIGGVVSVVGGAIFILVVVGSILMGEPVPANAKCIVAPPADAGGHKKIGMGGLEAPGTFVLALTLFVCLVLYYFVNFKYLATLWPMN
ncbi:MAG: cytochrome c oxidase subunit I [Gallionellaceae bacterium]|nr:MAG: cytochrome c oxidase subunit I [Gallionellaceae bacterium]